MNNDTIPKVFSTPKLHRLNYPNDGTDKSQRTKFKFESTTTDKRSYLDVASGKVETTH